ALHPFSTAPIHPFANWVDGSGAFVMEMWLEEWENKLCRLYLNWEAIPSGKVSNSFPLSSLESGHNLNA
ncbi:MAG: hypothetical protein D6728_19155, partial [Cyanobacteria bacterium J055]